MDSDLSTRTKFFLQVWMMEEALLELSRECGDLPTRHEKEDLEVNDDKSRERHHGCQGETRSSIHVRYMRLPNKKEG